MKAVDFDGTLVTYGDWKGPRHIGDAIPQMMERVKKWLADGETVVIFTARVHPCHGEDAEAARQAIVGWCEVVFGRELTVTHEKHPEMDEIWDDKAIQVVKNTGLRADGVQDCVNAGFTWR